MNNRTIAITAGVVGGLVGLGVLVYYLVNEDKDEPNFDKKETEPENNHPASKLSVQKTTKQNRLVEQPAKKAAKVIPITAAVTEPNAEESKAPAPISDEFPLRLGSKGDRVERLRVWLMRNYGWTGTINDEFDEKTEGLVKKYLKKDQVDEDTFYELKMGKPVYEQTLKGKAMAKKAGIKGYLDALVDEDGLKTEVKITITDQTLLKTGIYVVGMVVVSSVAFFTIRGIVKNMESVSQLKTA